MEENQWLITIFGIILIIGLFELFILGTAFFMADKVECNWLWCTFTTENTISSISQTCSSNGIPINCSEIKVIIK